jgi:hypothetical protein
MIENDSTSRLVKWNYILNIRKLEGEAGSYFFSKCAVIRPPGPRAMAIACR